MQTRGDRVRPQRVRPDGADSTEFDPDTPHPVIALITNGCARQLEQRDERSTGRHHAAGRSRAARRGQLRARRSTAARGQRTPPPPLRSSTANTKTAEAAGLRSPAQTPDGVYVEICEIRTTRGILGCQFHPEFKSKPLEPHPLFSAFIGAAVHEAARTRRVGQSAAPCIRKVQQTALPVDRSYCVRLRRGRAAAGADRRAVRDRKRRARSTAWRGDRRRAGYVRLQRPLSTRPTGRARASYRGPGLKEGLRILAGVKAEGFPILTDIHEPRRPTGGRRSRRHSADSRLPLPPDRPCGAGRTGRVVNIKKGQFVAPHDMRHVVDKAEEASRHRTTRIVLPSAASRSATTTWWWTCADWR